MTKRLLGSLLLSPAFIMASVLVAAAQVSQPTEPVNQSLTNQSLTELTNRSTLTLASDPIAQSSDDFTSVSALDQVTSVSQLTDVRPTDWAFQALQSLVERYGCIVGYPDRKYRGNQALTRYEFAAGLNACLDRVNELIAAGTADLVKKEDLAILQKLQEEFRTELATLRGRVDALEARTSTLEKQQFSTTTKLNGEVVFAVAGVATGQDARGEDVDKITVLGDRIRLNFDASFTGEDLLRVRLQALNFNAFSSTTFTPEGDFRFAGAAFGLDNDNAVGVDALLYQFPIGESTTVVLEANAGAIDDFTNTVNPYFDGDGGSGALTHFGTRNPIYYLANGTNGTGIGIKHEFGENLELSLGYLAADAANPARKAGLFDGSYGFSAQLTFKPSDKFLLGLTYINAYNTNFIGNGSTGSNRANLRTALLDNPNLPDALSPFAGLEVPVSNNAFGVEASFQIAPQLVLNGSVGYTQTRTLSSLGGVLPRGDLDIWNWSVGLAVPDFLKEGSVAGVIVGMEPKVTGVSRSLRSTIGKDPDTSLHIEGFYQFQLSDNIAITPAVVWLTAPDHNNDNSDIVIGVIRTTFVF